MQEPREQQIWPLVVYSAVVTVTCAGSAATMRVPSSHPRLSLASPRGARGMWALVELGQKRTRSVQPCCGPGFLFLLGVGGGPDSCGDTSSHSRRLLDPWAS